MLILSGYGAEISPKQKQYVMDMPKKSTVKPQVEEKPGFLSTLFTKTAEGVAATITGQSSQAPTYTPSYYPDSESGKIFGINQYYVYAGAGISILALLLILKKIRSKRQSGMIVNPSIQTIQLPIK